MTSGDGQKRSLRSAALHGVKWTAAARLVAEAVGLAAVVVTARLLTPYEVGQAAVALVVVAVAVGLAQQGFGSAVVRKPTLGERDASSAHMISIAFGFGVGLLVAGLALLVGDSLGPSTDELMALASISFPITAVGAVPMAMLQRELNFRSLAMIDAVASFAGGATTIALAVRGAGPEAMIVGPLVLAAVTSVGCVVYSERFGWRWSAAAGKEFWSFGLPTATSGLLYIAARNVDYAILAARVPTSQLGYYFRAYQLGGEYQSKVSGVMLRMALPLFARAKDPEELRRIRSKMSRAHIVALFPFLVLLIVLAPHVVPFLFGPNWEGAIVPTQILAVAGMVAVVGTGSGPLLTAAGHPNPLLTYTLVAVIIYGATVWVLAPLGIVAVSIGVVVNKLGSLYVLQKFYVERLVGIPVRDLVVHDILPALEACLPLAIVAFAGQLLLGELTSSDALIVLVTGPIGLVAYIGTLRVRSPAAWNDLMQTARRSKAAEQPSLPMNGNARA